MDDFTILASVIAQLHIQVARLQAQLAEAQKGIREPETKSGTKRRVAVHPPADNQ